VRSKVKWLSQVRARVPPADARAGTPQAQHPYQRELAGVFFHSHLASQAMQLKRKIVTVIARRDLIVSCFGTQPGLFPP
jgi:hypothetical protein